MKTIKRSLIDRFYNRGYRAGIGGKSRELCPGKVPLIYHQYQRGNRDYRNGQLSYVLSFSLTVISSKSASKTDPLSLVATCDC